MKKLLLAATAGFYCFLISCNAKTDNTTADSSTNSEAEQARQLNRDVIKGIETGDSSKLSFISSDAVDHNGGPNGREIKGDSIRYYLADMHNHFSDLKFDIISDAVDSNGKYIYTWSRMTGTAKDASMGMPAGAKFDMKSVDVTRFKNGKIVEHWAYMDPTDMMKMMMPSGSMQNQGNMDQKKENTKK